MCLRGGSDGLTQIAANTSLVVGFASDYGISLNTPINVAGSLTLGNSVGNGSLSTVNIIGAGNITVASGGTLANYAAPSAATPISSQDQGQDIEVQNTGTLALIDNTGTNHPPAQTIGVGIQVDTGGIMNIFGGNWNVTGQIPSYPSTSIYISGGTMNISYWTGYGANPANTITPSIYCTYAIKMLGLSSYLDVYSNCIIDADWVYLYEGTMQFGQSNYYDATFECPVQLGGGSGFWLNMYMSISSKASDVITENGYTLLIAPNAWINVNSLETGPATPGLIWTLIDTLGSGGILGDFQSWTLPPGISHTQQGQNGAEYYTWNCRS